MQEIEEVGGLSRPPSLSPEIRNSSKGPGESLSHLSQVVQVGNIKTSSLPEAWFCIFWQHFFPCIDAARNKAKISVQRLCLAAAGTIFLSSTDEASKAADEIVHVQNLCIKCGQALAQVQLFKFSKTVEV